MAESVFRYEPGQTYWSCSGIFPAWGHTGPCTFWKVTKRTACFVTVEAYLPELTPSADRPTVMGTAMPTEQRVGTHPNDPTPRQWRLKIHRDPVDGSEVVAVDSAVLQPWQGIPVPYVSN